MKRMKEMLDDEFVQLAIVVVAIITAVAIPLSPML